VRTILLGVALSLGILGGVPGEPVPKHVQSMIYDAAAATARIQGDVVIRVRVDSKGSVISATAASGPPALETGAVANARTWTFVPGRQGIVDITYSFHLTKPYVLYTAPTSTIFDLPNHVTVVTNFKDIAGTRSHIK
jgi:TonB family protein